MIGAALTRRRRRSGVRIATTTVETITTAAGTTNVESVFGPSGNDREMLAQGFTVVTGGQLYQFTITIANGSSPTDSFAFSIHSTLAGAALGSGTIAASSMNTTLQDRTVTLGAPLQLTPGSYFVVFSRTGARDATNRYTLAYNNTAPYAGGSAWVRASGVWTEQTARDYRVVLPLKV